MPRDEDGPLQTPFNRQINANIMHYIMQNWGKAKKESMGLALLGLLCYLTFPNLVYDWGWKETWVVFGEGMAFFFWTCAIFTAIYARKNGQT